MPRLDSDPVFCSLLEPRSGTQGRYSIELEGFEKSTQHYLRNTAILVTTLHARDGSAVEVTDFAPRFHQFGRSFYPMTIVRRIRRVAGSPLVTIRLEPAFDYGSGAPSRTFGSNHIRFVSPQLVLRLTTDASITALLESLPFVLDRDLTLILGPDETITEAASDVGLRFLGETRGYWHQWVRYLGIPFEWQEAVIRAAITIKLAAFDDTGAIVAALTTSIPEAPDSGRNWDYRYCWIRDAYFVIEALNRLGATGTMERYLHYIVNVAARTGDERLQPVYGIDGRAELAESIVGSLAGFQSMGPVRLGNAAYTQQQNDVFGSIVLAATHVFFDERLERPGDEGLFHRLERLGDAAFGSFNKPDAGIWELRNTARVHTFSSVMCWVACDRLARIAAKLELAERRRFWQERADIIHRTVCREAWSPEERSFVESFGGRELDASLLLLNELGFLAADDPRFECTLAAIERSLMKDGFIFRYVQQDDFGTPETAFLVCTFWYIDALAATGQREKARAIFETLLSCRNPLGLFSEDIDPASRTLWGNFPQTYSMVGLINSAMRLSRSWEESF
ncbi:MAG: glycoside hydrolase family 15 protein [Acidobacteria bacterium]|nr:glycoside hydrolase family 15 protein [Acidobacteriota bacterium]